MAALGVFIVITLGAVRLCFWSRHEKVRDGLLQRGLITFEGQNIVGLALDDLAGDGPLTTHGVNRHNTPLEGQQL